MVKVLFENRAKSYALSIHMEGVLSYNFYIDMQCIVPPLPK
jgi:hypothetical protein